MGLGIRACACLVWNLVAGILCGVGLGGTWLGRGWIMVSGLVHSWGGAWWGIAWGGVGLGIMACAYVGWHLASGLLHPVGFGGMWLGEQ